MKIKNIDNSKKNRLNILTIVAVLLIIIIGILIRIEVGKNKIYFHMDEIYSYGLVNNDEVQFGFNEDLFNEIHTGDYYREYFEISDEEKYDFSPVYNRQKEDVHPPLYYLFLRIFNQFNLNNFSKWTGISLNIFIYVISALFIFKFTNKITKDKRFGIFPVYLYTISALAINNSIYIRMYELLMFLILLFAYYFIKIIEEENFKEDLNKNIKEELKKDKNIKENIKKDKNYIILGIITILGMLTQYYFAFIVVLTLNSFYIYTITKSKNEEIKLRKKEIKDKLNKIVKTFIFSAIIYLIIWPYSILHVFGEKRQAQMNFFETLKQFLNYVNTGALNIYISFILISILSIFNRVLNRKKLKINSNKIEKEKEKEIEIEKETKTKIKENKKSKINIYIFLTVVIIYFLIISILAITNESSRFIYPIIPLYILLVLSLIYLEVKEIFLNLEIIESNSENKKEIKKETENKNKIDIKTNLEIIAKTTILMFLTILILPQINNSKKLLKNGFELQYLQNKEYMNFVEENKETPLLYLYDDKQLWEITDDIFWLSDFDYSLILSRNKDEEKNLELEKDRDYETEREYLNTDEYIEKIKNSKIDELNEKGNNGIFILIKPRLDNTVLENYEAEIEFEKENLNFKINEETKENKLDEKQIYILSEITKYLNYKNIELVSLTIENEYMSYLIKID